MVELDKIITSVAVISGILVPWFVYRRSVKLDKISEQSGIASNNAAGVAQAFEGLKEHITGLNNFIAILQADSRVDKEDIKILTSQRDVLQKELNRMYRKYGDDSNGW